MAIRTVTGRTDRIVVVGSGFAGLAAALRLAGSGRQVTVCERWSGPGGKALPVLDGGYVFDGGPTVLTLPELVADAMRCVGVNFEDRVELVPVDPVYRAVYADGQRLDVIADEDRMAAQIAGVCGAREADGYRRYVAFLRRLYECEFPAFIDRNMDGMGRLLTADLARLIGMGGFRSLESKVGQYLRDPRIRTLFTFQALYAGLSPARARALYGIIAYLDTVAGAYVPRGGVHRLPAVLAEVAADHGVEFRYDTEVTGVRRGPGGRVEAVVTSQGEQIATDAVIITADPGVAFPELLHRPPPRVNYAPSCFVLQLGVRGEFGFDAHHTMNLGGSWKRSFAELRTDGKTMGDPTFLVSVASKSDPALAPAGRHSMCVQVPVPNLGAALDWSELAEPYRDQIIETMEKRGYSGIGSAIEVEHILTPLDWAQRGNPLGTPFSAAQTFWQTGPFRTSNLVEDNIVLAGAGTHPGTGVPTALISGKLAAQRITG